MANRKRSLQNNDRREISFRDCFRSMVFSPLTIQETLKDLLSGMIRDMLETEMDNHLGYDRYEISGESNDRNFLCMQME